MESNSEPPHAVETPASPADLHKVPSGPAPATALSPSSDTAEVIIRETRTEIEQIRLQADKFICQYAEAYVAEAGRLRQGAIDRYRVRLEGLSPDLRLKVCETLAKDDIFCCNMEFGNGHLSYAGMGFTYKVESDVAFNVLSHHAWKDLHRSFTKDSHKSSDQDRAPSPLPDMSLDGEHVLDLEPCQDEMDGFSDEKTSSSDSEASSLSSVDLPEVLPSGKRKRHQGSDSLSPKWLAGEESESAPLKQRVALNLRNNVAGGRWSADDDTYMRTMMEAQLQAEGHLSFRHDTATKLRAVFPYRSVRGIEYHWRMLRLNRNKPEERVGGGSVLDARRLDEDSSQDGPTLSMDDDNNDSNNDDGSRSESAKRMGHNVVVDRGSRLCEANRNESDPHYEDALVSVGLLENKKVECQRKIKPQVAHSNVKFASSWKPEQDKLLKSRMEQKMELAGVTYMPATPDVTKELGEAFDRSADAIARRWARLSGRIQLLERRKAKSWSAMNGGSSNSGRQSEALKRARTPSSKSLISTQRRGLRAQTSRERPGHPTWSREEIDRLTILTKDIKDRSSVDWTAIAAQMPFHRTVEALKIYHRRHVIIPSQLPGVAKESQSPDTQESKVTVVDHVQSEESARSGKKDTWNTHAYRSISFDSSKRRKFKARGAVTHSALPVDMPQRKFLEWTREQDDLLRRLVGKPWDEVATHLPGRTPAECQTRYTTCIVGSNSLHERAAHHEHMHNNQRGTEPMKGT